MKSLPTKISVHAATKAAVSIFSFLLAAYASAQIDSTADTTSTSTDASACTNEARTYATKMGSGPADEAYEFGRRIQMAVSAGDLNSLFELAAEELDNGPRRKFLKNKMFSEIFSEEWRLEVLAQEPDCAPVGWRGYALGRGLIWFSKGDQGWTIFSINGASSEPLDTEAWKYNGQLLTRACFTTIWFSDDNYEEYEERFGPGSDFYGFPGRYVGGTIPLDPIMASWGVRLSFAVKLSDCIFTEESGDIAVTGGLVTEEVCDEFNHCLDQRYTALRRVSQEHCSTLAPFFSNRCIDIRLVKIADQTGGSMGDDVQIGIFGIVEDPVSTELYVTPLVNFGRLNSALNFVDNLEGSSRRASDAKQPSKLHPSVREFAHPVLDGATEHYLIRIDSLGEDASGEQEYRYAVWQKGSSTATRPDLVLAGGKVRYEVSDKNRVYTFANGNFRYIVSVILVGDERRTALTVTKEDELLLSEPFLSVVRSR